MAPEELTQAIGELKCSNENLLVDMSSSEDAAVYKIDDEKALVQSVDIITPVVDDPYYYGQIAAANSLSDIFAMGGEVLTAMNVVGFDGCHHKKNVLKEILFGAKSKLDECGGVLAGGHTIETPEMLYGLSVTGVVHPNKIYKNSTARVGDVIVLTKPLGLGVLTTALKADMIDENIVKYITSLLAQLNYNASKVMKEFDVSACTDVTGFGFLGHLYEMVRNDIAFLVKRDNVPIIEGALDMAEMGIIPAGSYNNKSYLSDKVKFLSEDEKDILLFDAQTSGGLLIAVSQKDANKLVRALKDSGYEKSSIVAEVVVKNEYPIVITG